MNVTGTGPVDVPRSVLADAVVERLTTVYAAAADSERAGPIREALKNIGG